MNATQIGSMGTISATIPTKFSGLTRSSSLPEAFGPKLQRDMLAAEASISKQSPTTAKLSPAMDGPIARVTSPPIAANATTNPSQKQPGRAIPSTLNYSGQSVTTPKLAAPTIAAGQGVPVAEKPTIQSAADAAIVPKVETAPVPPAKVNAMPVLATKAEAVPVPPTKVDAVPPTKVDAVPPTKVNATPAPPTSANSMPALATEAEVAPVPETKVEAIPGPATKFADAPAPATELNAAPVFATSGLTVPVVAPKLDVVPAPVPVPKAEAVPVAATKAASFPSVKRAAKASSPASSSQVAGTQGVASAAFAVVPSIAVQGSIPAVAIEISGQHNPAADHSRPATSVSSLPQPQPPSTVSEFEKPTLATPVPAGLQGFPPDTTKQASPPTGVQSKTHHGTISSTAAAAVGIGTTGIPANTTVTSAIASNSHPNQTATPNVVTQIPTPVSPALSSARTDLQPAPTTSLDSAGIGQVHILPSAPTQLDVGVLDGTHGWLQIRAELSEGGGVRASLTAGPVAHESLNAALPEMAKYLGSEGVSVSSLAVHRYAEDANPVPSSTSEGLLNANTQGHRSGGDEQRDGSGNQPNQSQAADSSSTPSLSAATSPLTGPSVDDADVPSGSTLGFSRAVPGFFSPLGVAGGSSGNWLNVSA